MLNLHKTSFKMKRSLIMSGLLIALPMVGLANFLSTSVAGGAYGGVTCNAAGASSASCYERFSGTTILGYPYFGTIEGTASASYGSLSAGAEYLPSSTAVDGEELATATFMDTLTILGGSGDGFISYHFDGNFTTISDFGVGFLFQQNPFAPEGFGIGDVDEVDVPFDYHTALYQFVFGVPFTIRASVHAYAAGEGYSNTLFNANLDGITVLNANDQAFTGYTITAQSGANYPLPEPSSFVLLGTLATLLVGLRYRRWIIINTNHPLFKSDGLGSCLANQVARPTI